ncbi:hypothetical protein GT037_004775, partial [Alternaria burnsii]
MALSEINDWPFTSSRQQDLSKRHPSMEHYDVDTGEEVPPDISDQSEAQKIQENFGNGFKELSCSGQDLDSRSTYAANTDDEDESGKQKTTQDMPSYGSGHSVIYDHKDDVSVTSSDKAPLIHLICSEEGCFVTEYSELLSWSYNVQDKSIEHRLSTQMTTHWTSIVLDIVKYLQNVDTCDSDPKGETSDKQLEKFDAGRVLSQGEDLPDYPSFENDY